jgi:hypothetical protein
MFWQVGLLILLIGGIDRLIRKWAWPQLRYALWSLILVKLLLPPTGPCRAASSRIAAEAAQACWLDSEEPASAKNPLLFRIADRGWRI